MSYLVKLDEHEYTTTNVDFVLNIMKTGRPAAIGMTMNLASLEGETVHIGNGAHIKVKPATLDCLKVN